MLAVVGVGRGQRSSPYDEVSVETISGDVGESCRPFEEPSRQVEADCVFGVFYFVRHKGCWRYTMLSITMKV